MFGACDDLTFLEDPKEYPQRYLFKSADSNWNVYF